MIGGIWQFILAWLHLSDDAVCELSKSRGPRDDFHDYVDSDAGPWHFGEHRRCNKGFFI